MPEEPNAAAARRRPVNTQDEEGDTLLDQALDAEPVLLSGG